MIIRQIGTLDLVGIILVVLGLFACMVSVPSQTWQWIPIGMLIAFAGYLVRTAARVWGTLERISKKISDKG